MNILKKENVSMKNTISILIIAMVLSSFVGFIYEEIFYRIDLGYFVKRGSSFTVFVPIYAWGCLLICLFTYRFKNKPLVVFTLNCLITGCFEYLSGLFLDKIYNLKLWDYNKEMLNFLNINGYVCLRSVLSFGLASLLLIYLILPKLIKLFKEDEKKWRVISYICGGIYLIDTTLYQILK